MKENSRNILVVDDDAMTRDLICFKLRQNGFTATPVDDGLHAVLKFKEGKYDLVILDVMLPDLSGLEVMNFFRYDNDMKRTPVIFISRLGNPKVKIAADKLGAAGYLEKPFEIEALLEKISHLPGFES